MTLVFLYSLCAFSVRVRCHAGYAVHILTNQKNVSYIFWGYDKPNVANLFLGLTGKMQAYIFKVHFAYPPQGYIFLGPPLLICREEQSSAF